MIVIAAGLLLSPAPSLLGRAGLGAAPAFAQECKIEIKICQEFNLHFYRWETCFTYRALCD
jgi:hypothetical protein